MKKQKKSTKKRNFFKENYSKCFSYFNEFKNHFLFSLAIFCFFFIVGFAYPEFFRSEIISFIKELEVLIEGKSALELTNFIFFNNLKASAIAMVLGIAFGIVPFFVAVSNGYLLGFVSHEAVAAEGLWTMMRLFPHGIFELPAVLFSIALGMKLGTSFFNIKTLKKLKYNFKESIRFFIFIIFPLLLVAAIIEGILIASGI
ncbi:stage II sporulation protein M [archaeon]|jgi:stage II sporulation protein M|nr:stage II sporulation protein M [archaeon]MBT6606767.1 stage II sporulation protein M [archaeon]MBT7251760.1 stage II sporulation protein M [archaeon]MBT7660679.1 stage II sporulation protein M [archaeon]